MTFLIARPETKAQKTLEAFKQQGLQGKIYPVVRIEFKHADENLKAFKQAAPSMIIITSTYAAQWLITQILKQTLRGDFTNIDLVCVGASSAKVLQDAKLNSKIFIASPENSEGLLALPCLHDINAQSIVLLKGEGGRMLITETLRHRKANIVEISVYKRVKNTHAMKSFAFEQSEIKCIIATSVEITDLLFATLDTNWLQNLHWIVASDRIKNTAYNKGVTHLTVSKGAHNTALLASAKYLKKTGAFA